MVARSARLAVRRQLVRGLRTKTFGPRLVTPHVVLDGGCGRNINRGCEEFEDQAPAQPDSLRVGLYVHTGFGLSGATGDESAHALHFDDTDSANIHRSQRFEIT